ncbi:MAG: hypothetical protein K1000chlam3_01623 [Chlamydiae bacterium]|nr:hypothetical protein [Chlamydiota bacterium]
MGTITNYISTKYNNIVDSAHQARGLLSELYEFSPPLYTLIGRIYRSTVLFSFTGYLYYYSAYRLSCARASHESSSIPIGKVWERMEKHKFLLLIAFIIGITSSLFTIAIFEDLPSIPREWEIRKLAKDQSKKNVVLHCVPKNGDWNGATTRQTKKEIEILRELSKTHSIVHKIVSSPRDINSAIDEIRLRGQEVKILWINAHGNPDVIQLNLFQTVKGKNINEIQFTKLAPDADIVLQSCSVGKKYSNWINFAEWVQIYAGRKRKIHAPKDVVSIGETIYTKTWWSGNKFLFFQQPLTIIPVFSPVTANISYFSAFNKARRLGHDVKTDSWTTSLLVLISQIWEKIFQFRN